MIFKFSHKLKLNHKKESIKQEPDSLNEYEELLRKRLKVRQLKNLSTSDQEELVIYLSFRVFLSLFILIFEIFY